jgi:hypothetical protein
VGEAGVRYVFLMAPRWVKTQDYRDTVFEPAHPMDDWLLLSHKFVVGRVLRDRSGAQAGRYSWSLTGIHGAPIQNHGVVDTLEQAQAELMANWRRWQEWAGMRDIDSLG